MKSKDKKEVDKRIKLISNEIKCLLWNLSEEENKRNQERYANIYLELMYFVESAYNRALKNKSSLIPWNYKIVTQKDNDEKAINKTKQPSRKKK